jgi:tetratricopeptide (TPR) repeat protein
LDRERFERERIEDASPTDLVIIVQEQLKNATAEQLPYLLSLIDRAFEGNLSAYHDYQALAFRLKGEINESLGNNDLAISAYREAIGINPKIGVKQRLKKLEKASPESGASKTKKKDARTTTGSVMNSQTPAESVLELIYTFTQYAFIGGSIKEAPLDAKMFPSTFEILRAGPLSQQELAVQPLPIQRVIYELLTQYVMFFTMNPSLPFPPDFLAESNSKLLGHPITAYMAQHEWPFPQMLRQ